MISCLTSLSVLGFKLSEQWRSTGSGDFAPHPQWTFGNIWTLFWGSRGNGREAAVSQWGEARNAAEHLTINKTASYNTLKLLGDEGEITSYRMLGTDQMEGSQCWGTTEVLDKETKDGIIEKVTFKKN